VTLATDKIRSGVDTEQHRRRSSRRSSHDYYAANPASDGTDEDLTALFAEAQGAKTFINEAAGRIVDRALALSGGGAYLNGSPIARAYRDVRAGAFMNPLGADRAYELVGRTALGLEPALS
jgi:alkylation response protein AidB-like acyl-CoA dehydrogenase